MVFPSMMRIVERYNLITPLAKLHIFAYNPIYSEQGDLARKRPLYNVFELFFNLFKFLVFTNYKSYSYTCFLFFKVIQPKLSVSEHMFSKEPVNGLFKTTQ